MSVYEQTLAGFGSADCERLRRSLKLYLSTACHRGQFDRAQGYTDAAPAALALSWRYPEAAVLGCEIEPGAVEVARDDLIHCANVLVRKGQS